MERRRRRALFMLFGLPGVVISSWVTRSPDIRDSLQASTEQMGFLLFGISIGSVLGIGSSAALVSRYGVRSVARLGMTCVVMCLPAVTLGVLVSEPAIVALGLFSFGLGMGGSEIAVNLEATALERASGMTVLPSMHGSFSLGAVLGASTGVSCSLLGVSVPAHLTAVSVITAAILMTQIHHLSRCTYADPAEVDGRPTKKRRELWTDRRLLSIAIIVLAMGLAEGAATDWLPLLVVDGDHGTATSGALVYAAFAAAMTTGRFGASFFLRRLGPASVLRWSASVAGLGIASISLLGVRVLLAPSALLWGIGLAVVFPVAITAAANTGSNSSSRVAFVTVVAYSAFLVGPPMLGVLGEHFGLRDALLVPLALVALAGSLASGLNTRPKNPDSPRPSSQSS